MALPWILHAIYASLLGQSSMSPPQADTGYYITTHTAYGDLLGMRKYTPSNFLVDSHLGIPFAHPPVGHLRFSRPEPPLWWSGVRNATRFENECLQRSLPGFVPFSVNERALAQSEDCLYLNVYAPANAPSAPAQLLPVMVWIPGEAFVSGAGSHFDGSELAAFGDVVVVTLNYRVGVFGFLSNEDDVMPGNYGMLDQIMALEWVKGNIRNFGGDSNNVTIFGQSAGSDSVSLLVLSPLAKGLFHRAIMESGVSLSRGAVTSPAARMTPATTFALVANALGCTDDKDIAKKLHCLRTVDAHRLLNISVTVENLFPTSNLYGPRVENTFSFLPDLPMNLLMQNKFNNVDTIRGYTTHELGSSVLDLQNVGLSKEDFLKSLKDDFQAYVFAGKNSLIDKIAASYITNETDKMAIRSAVVRAKSDYQFKGPAVIEASIQSKLAAGNKHYLYEFEYKSSFSRMPSWQKATHSEEIPFVFGLSLPEFQRFMPNKTATPVDLGVSRQILTMWSNFAKSGNPTQSVPPGGADWAPYNTSQGSQFLTIGKTSHVSSFKDPRAILVAREVLHKLQTYYDSDVIVG